MLSPTTAHILALGCAAASRRGPVDGTLACNGCGVCSACFNAAAAGGGTLATRGDDILGLESEGGDRHSRPASRMEWGLPLPPIRFPLRDALLSVNREHSPKSVTELGSAIADQHRGPLVVQHTAKSRRQMEYGRQRSRNRCAASGPRADGAAGTGMFDSTTTMTNGHYGSELSILHTPRPPPEAGRPASVPRSMPSKGSLGRKAFINGAETTGADGWPIHRAVAIPRLEKRDALKHLAGKGMDAGAAAQAVMVYNQTHNAAPGLARSTYDPSSVLTQTPLTSARSLQRTLEPEENAFGAVRNWTCRGLHFSDAGLGIGHRFPVKEAASTFIPGPGAYGQHQGNIALWSPEATLQAKQPMSQHHSTPTYRMGQRRKDEGLVSAHPRPGPGTYEFRGFADELTHKCKRRQVLPGTKVGNLQKSQSDPGLGGGAARRGEGQP